LREGAERRGRKGTILCEDGQMPNGEGTSREKDPARPYESGKKKKKNTDGGGKKKLSEAAKKKSKKGKAVRKRGGGNGDRTGRRRPELASETVVEGEKRGIGNNSQKDN